MERKKIIIGAAVVIALIAIFAIRSAMKNSSRTESNNATTTQENILANENEVKYTDPAGRFRFIHSKDFKITSPLAAVTTLWRSRSTTPGYLLATMVVPKTFMPGTNFSDAKLTVGVSTDSRELGAAGCPLNTTTRVEPGVASAPEINGQTYTKLTYKEAAAGNLYETTGYYTIRDGDCYAIEYTIHSTNIANYPVSSGIKEFDKSKIVGVLEKVVKSFVFLINSD